MANKTASEGCVCIIRADELIQTCSAHDAAFKNRESAEVTRMDKRTRHLLNRIEDAEAALLCRDTAYQDEYWKRYPESERGKFTASGSQDLGEKMADEYLEAEAEHMADRVTVDSKQDHSWVNQGICCSRHATPIQRATTMLVCPECGDKRCPKAADCGATCADSREK